MKVRTPQNIEVIIDGIVSDRETQAKVLKQTFSGVSKSDLLNELSKRLEDDSKIDKAPPIKFTKQDMNAVANNRFYRKTGVRLLMVLIIIILGLALLTTTFRIIPTPIYLGLSGLAALVFLYIYARKQQESKKEFFQGLRDMGYMV